MDSRRFDLEQDLQEIDRLLTLSTRNHTKELLITHRLKLSQELKSLPISSPNSSSQPAPEHLIYKPIDRFSWEQTSDSIKIYVTCLEGLKTHPKENIHLESTKDSITVSITDFGNANYRLRFPKLLKEIKPGKITLKSNGFSLTFPKNDNSHWDSLVPKAGLIKKPEEEEEKSDKDPGDSLMKMMKDLYDTGDDDMKRTITEAWAKAKDKEN